MKFKFKSLSILLLFISIFLLVGCTRKNDNTSASTNATAPTNSEYYSYLTERYNYYFKNNTLDTTYDIFADNYTYNDSYDDFIKNYNGSYDELKTNLEAFKSDLENNVSKGNSEVDKVNQEVITSVDKAIVSVDDYNSSFAEKATDYATLSKDEVIKGLRNLSQTPHEARIELDNIITNAKSDLGIN